MKWINANEVTSDSLASRYCRDYARYKPEFIHNLQTDLYLLDTGNQHLVCSVNNPEQTINAYVVSPYCAYIDYCLVEIARLKKTWITWPLTLLVKMLGLWLRAARIDSTLQINNWLLSTNLYPPDLSSDPTFNIREIRDQAIKKFPQQSIIFRSLNRRTNADLIDSLCEQGFIKIPSRQVYFFDASLGTQSAFTQKHNFGLDRNFLRKTPLNWRAGNEFSPADFQRAAHLYQQLYIEKYCQHNPQYSANWLQAGQTSGWLRLQGLVDDNNQLQAVVGWFENNDVLTAPIVGYNTSLPKKQGLYRLLTQACLEEACRQKKLLNFSSGAAEFKRLRGGEAEIEYSLVYIEHLPWFRRSTWKTLAFFLNHLAVPLMKKWKL